VPKGLLPLVAAALLLLPCHKPLDAWEQSFTVKNQSSWPWMLWILLRSNLKLNSKDLIGHTTDWPHY
jgi:hypothetical protein